MHVLSFITILVQCPRCPLLVTASWEVDTILMTLNHNFKHLELVSMTHISVHFYTQSCSPVYCKLVMNCEKLRLSTHTTSNHPVNIRLIPVDVQNVPLMVMAWSVATICSSDVGLN